MVIRVVLHVQVTVPSLQSRFSHSATAFSLSPGLTEVTIFGGSPNVPSNLKSDADLPLIANTTVLRFGESHLMCVHRSCDRDTTIASHDYVTMQAFHGNQLNTDLYTSVYLYLKPFPQNTRRVPPLVVPPLESGS